MSPINKLTKLTFLGLGYNQIIVVPSIENLTALTYLVLSNNQIINIDELFNLLNLRVLSLVNDDISCTDLKNLKTTLSSTDIISWSCAN